MELPVLSQSLHSRGGHLCLHVAFPHYPCFYYFWIVSSPGYRAVCAGLRLLSVQSVVPALYFPFELVHNLQRIAANI